LSEETAVEEKEHLSRDLAESIAEAEKRIAQKTPD
jgi:hypothetical protein